MIERAKQYFILAEQYLTASKCLLKVLIENGNSNCGIGNTMEEAVDVMNKNIVNSDVRLFVPTIFDCYQATELFIKGLLLIKNIEIEENHVVENMIDIIKNAYGEESDIYKEFRKFYKYQISIIQEYKKDNNISNIKEIYESLRYPESKKNNKQYSYESLKNNGKDGIKQFKKIYEEIDTIYKITCREWKNTSKN